jgi:hypothetical protein
MLEELLAHGHRLFGAPGQSPKEGLNRPVLILAGGGCSAGGDGGRRSPDGVYSLTRRSQSRCRGHVPR